MIIDGKKIAEDIQAEIKETISLLKSKRAPCLAVIIVGHHPPSLIYINHKTIACQSVGIQSIKRHLAEETTENELLKEIEELNLNPLVDGILVQLPLPKHIDPHRVINHIHPEKDVDGFHPFNMGKLLTGQLDGFISCTPLGIKVLMERSQIKTEGKHVVIIGRSNIVGKPLAALLLQNAPGANATVTVAHSATKNLSTLSQTADILIAAMGSPRFVQPHMVKEGAVVIDVGTNKIVDPTRTSGFRIVGDVDFEAVKPKCLAITPVPRGVGPMTITMLLQNTLTSYQKKNPL